MSDVDSVLATYDDPVLRKHLREAYDSGGLEALSMFEEHHHWWRRPKSTLRQVRRAIADSQSLA